MIFVALSLDEAASIHERALVPLRRALSPTGVLTFAWVIPGALFVALVGAALYAACGMGLATAIESIAEETLEMAGIVVFIHALLVHLEQVAGPVAFRIEPTT